MGDSLVQEQVCHHTEPTSHSKDPRRSNGNSFQHHLNELAEVSKPRLLCLWDLPDEDEDRVNDGLLELEAAVLPQHVAEEVHEGAVLLGELQAQGADGLHHHDLELVGDVRHEGGHLLEQALHAALRACLQQRGDGQRGDAAILVRDEGLHVQVAVHHRSWVGLSHLHSIPSFNVRSCLLLGQCEPLAQHCLLLCMTMPSPGRVPVNIQQKATSMLTLPIHHLCHQRGVMQVT